jgi:cytochrome c-type biogenesis protein CcmH
MSARVVLFWLLALIMFSGVTAAVVWPLLRRPRQRTVVRKEVNVQVLRDQLVELETDLQAGTLSQGQYDEAKLDISKRLLNDLTADPIAPAPASNPAQLAGNRRLALILGITMPILAVAAYLWLGTPSALQEDEGASPAAVAAAAGAAQQQGGEAAGSGDAQGKAKHALTPEKIQTMIDGLRKKAEANPGDGQTWAMLARSYNFVGKFPEAVAAYQKAVPLNPKDAEILADYADALAMTQNRTLGPEPMKLIKASLQIDPLNMKALALSATEAFMRKDYKVAIDFWKRAIPAAQAREPEMAQQFRVNIQEANQLGGGKLIAEADIPGAPEASLAPAGGDAGASAGMPPAPMPPAGAGAGAAPAAAAGASVSGRVSLSAALKAKAAPGDSVFIFAKAATGPPMPLAVLRAKVQDLPMDFRLDESMAMMPGLKLGGFPALVVGARISKSGNASPTSGDLQGLLKGVKPGATGLQVEISEVVP